MSVTAAELRRRQPELGVGPFSSEASELFCRSARARLASRVHRRALDDRLAAGANPADCPDLAVRAAQLTAICARSRIADDLEWVVRRSRGPATLARVAPGRRAVATNAPRLAALVRRLRAGGPVYAGGVAQLQRLLCDGGGPLYTDRDGAALTVALDEIGRRLDG